LLLEWQYCIYWLQKLKEMKINTHDTFILVEGEENDLKKIRSFLASGILEKFKNHNLVINLLSYKNLTLDDLLLFLNISNQHKASKYSFVILNSAIDPDELPEEMVVVPTLQEAEDIIEMESIERELGF